MINYTTVDEKLRKDVVDAKVMRRMSDGSYHYVVLAKIKIEIDGRKVGVATRES